MTPFCIFHALPVELNIFFRLEFHFKVGGFQFALQNMKNYHIPTSTVDIVKRSLHPGNVLEKKLTGGLGLFFGSEIFDILIFFWVWKNLTYFFGSEDFSLIFFG